MIQRTTISDLITEGMGRYTVGPGNLARVVDLIAQDIRAELGIEEDHYPELEYLVRNRYEGWLGEVMGAR